MLALDPVWPACLNQSVACIYLSSSMHSQNHLGYLKPLRLLFLLNNHYFSSKKILFLNHDLSSPGQNRVLTRFSSCRPHFVPLKFKPGYSVVHPEVQARLQCWTACPLKHLAPTVHPEHPLWARHCQGRTQGGARFLPFRSFPVCGEQASSNAASCVSL